MQQPSDSSRTKPQLPPQAARLLARLRRRIRWYLWLEGLALVAIILGVGYWIGLSLDYGPVLLGSSEMPLAARRLYLVVLLVVAGAVFYRSTLRYVFRPLRNASLALLVERHYPDFRDSLITAVEASEHGLSATDANPRLVSATFSDMARRLDEVQLRPVFRLKPLLQKATLAGLLALSLLAFGMAARTTFAVWTPRFLLLSNEPWPRYAHIEVVGFQAGIFKVARGSDVTINVRADANRPTPPPAVCTIYYRTQEGEAGRVNMSRDGEPRGGYQYYVFNGKPFRGLLDNVRFDVIGFDHRVNDQWVQVVESPVVVQVDLQSELPAYTGLLPRHEIWNAGMQLPVGTRVSLRISTNKDLRSMTLTNPDTEEVIVREFASEPASLNSGGNADGSLRQVEHVVENLDGRYTLLIGLEDTDGIVSQQPFRFSLGAVADELPRVEAVLDGIGSAITPHARLPVSGTIKDDYGVEASWYLLEVKDRGTRTLPLAVGGDGQFQAVLDLREQRAAAEPFELKPGDKLNFSLQAKDYFNLSPEPHLGQSEPYALQVVRDDELLAILDGREVGLRRRFEQMKEEFTESRDTLLRARASWNPASREPPGSGQDRDAGAPAEESAPAAAETSAGESPPAGDLPADATAAPEGPAADEQRLAQNVADTRSRWVQWGAQQAERSKEELTSLALSFAEIREELINNRVDTPEREMRLAAKIIAPLREIAATMLPELRMSLDRLEQKVAARDLPAEAPLVVEQANQILAAMDQILQQMVELEDYAELVNIMRSIMDDQQRLLNETKEEQKRRLLDLFR
jgi:hypothetical protein